MTLRLQSILALASVAFATQSAAQVTFYAQDEFQGPSFSSRRAINDLQRFGFNDRASSVTVASERWEVCESRRFGGRCVVLRAGSYPSLAAMGLNDRISSARLIQREARIDAQRYAPAPVKAQITLYENKDFGGQTYVASQAITNFQRLRFNDRASSVEVQAGWWEACEDADFQGQCVLLRPGRYPSLAAMGLNNRISSVRVSTQAAHTLPAGPPRAADQANFNRRDDERLYQADVVSVRAVVGPPEKRCWIEREQVSAESRSSNVPGAIAGALLGGILGHQVGGGTGKDLATVGGAVAGAAIGAQAGRNNSTPQITTQDVERCREVPSSAKPQFWDVTYRFRGQDHQVQMTQPPGATVTVNAQGEPRT
ncbi:MAG: glycine zipper 2TM domain-containing protein [Rhodoferax sp.]|uniref:beta/gamma crystallin-related protein n=1 Tax=Rhodoferax sp. TaxID=50421 RepID=UPI001B77CDE4|nr:beta/gamma crystallin-related protein [Rhodoferax sp.]MBP9148522.1 glycine zipper 2TM domain-containing protein [Rhodoferax sp.]MBP9735254.1 glycine zipper 2TM domain-containing protein [Rhodoferax sp.]